MVVIKVPVRVCDFDTTKEQKNFWHLSRDLSVCERCGKDVCKYPRSSITN